MEIVLKYFSDFTDTQLAQFQALSGLYQEWNEKINVISRKDIDSLYEKHILHSLSIAAVADFPDGMQVLDLGTGGGFPGIPLAIFFPEVKFHLVDSIGKKIKVVQGVSEALGLKNVTYQHSRVEDIKDKKFDIVVSRAVAPLKDLWRWSKLVLKKAPAHEQQPGLICLKGGDLTEEIAESGVRPRMTNIYKLFPEDFFLEKHIVLVNK
ncbi:16S rRNA (guanine(527)-N(7))-methyltransferase RsmG [Chitinophaga rhizophila]|uniref:Ribosomal RNA small subunit methyltransferase G n=1 Tax=Chitinophaga rhizophila TaxID=2866212 RepID=A0ABS7GFZ5_9BACT|nr:16S rRNA (guanine(527)-N(7))-methyltransferase RsmG [Chitinophaga rhizophila]MBW8685423.1 16S rRNA (guanine(527)-N(7))-methyltransferase RsmG [Chitinophaga rhizophila]